MQRKIREWLNIQIVKNPSRVILFGIVIFNILFFLFAALIISRLAPQSLTERGFWASVFYTVTMILDAGCIQFVIEDVGQASVSIIIICIIIVIIGMITFTGCVVGYVTNMISSFIEHANTGSRKLILSDHTVILNWNNRASEIVNDLLYSEHKEKIVVLVSGNKDDVMSEIENRLADTIAKENQALLLECNEKKLTGIQRLYFLWRHQFRNNLTVIVRQGDTFSSKQLYDISLERAKTVIILNQDVQYSSCQYATDEWRRDKERGNPVTIKTLVLVAEITGAETSADNQKIIVEADDQWTEQLIDKIIAHKEHLGKCNIICVSVNRILGQLLSQFSIMPQLNQVYNELFSNRGAEFYAKPVPDGYEAASREKFLSNHFNAVPLTTMDTKAGRNCFFMADVEADLESTQATVPAPYGVKAKPDCWQPRRNIIILGHNSKVTALMDGFQSYRNEWNPARDGRDILNISVVDDEKNLEKMDYYRKYSYVNEPVVADVYDREKIYAAINDFIDNEDGDTAILILSDDAVSNENLDASALTYLIYVQDILTERKKLHGPHDVERIDVIVEILNPKNDDVVRSYDVENVVISNRYISKMITQIGEKDALFEFYSDILTYDEADADAYTSMELYIKRVADLFSEVPAPCTAAQLIRAIYTDAHSFDPNNTSLVLGYLDGNDRMTLFTGDQNAIPVTLREDYKLIVFTNH